MSAPPKHTRGGFYTPITSVDADTTENVRFETSYQGGDDTPGAEEISLKAMTETIKKLGQLQPVIVQATKNARWKVVAGFRRFLAVKASGALDVFCTEWVGPSLAGVREAENIARKRLNACELCFAVRDMTKKDGLSPTEISLRTGLEAGKVKLYLSVAQSVHASILAAWKRSPGAYTLDTLARIGTMSAERQLEWFRGSSAPSVPREPTKKQKSGRYRPGIAKLEKKRDEVRCRKFHADRSDDFRDGYLEALSFALGERR